MAHTRHSHKKIPAHRSLFQSVQKLVRFDTWRRVDLVLVIISIIFWLIGRFTFLPVMFIVLTVIELLFEAMIRHSNRDWQGTKEGEDWMRRMISAGRLFFISFKVVIVFIAMFLLLMGW